MGSITPTVGLASGIDTGTLIEQLLIIESQTKFRLERRVAQLQAEQTALLDVNSNLLGFKTASKAFRVNSIFDGTLTTSSHEAVLGASSDKTAQPGTYQFYVKQLVQTSQKLTQGYADRDVTPLGLSSLSFEFGKGNLVVDRDLEELNGGEGIVRGEISITDRNGESATIDLTDVTSVNEVLDRINEETDIAVTASVTENHIVLTDTTGGAGTLSVSEVGSGTTAASLGLNVAASGDTLTASDIYSLGGDTRLDWINDGNGVLVRNGTYDLEITTRDASRVFQVDLGRVNEAIDDDTLLSDLNNGAGITLNDDSDNPDFVIRNDTADTDHEINLTGIETVADLKSRIASETSGDFTLDVNAEGDAFVLTNVGTAGSGDTIMITGIGENGDDTAEDLGLFDETGFTTDTYEGSRIENLVSQAPVHTIQDVIDRINNALDTTDADNGGHIVASIAADGKSIQIEDTVGGGNPLIIDGGPGFTDGGAAADLGIYTTGFAGDIVDGTTVYGTMSSVLMSNLNGGLGLSALDEIDVQDRDGNSLTVDTLSTYDTLEEMLDYLNTTLTGNGVAVQFEYDSATTGLVAVAKSSGTGNMIVTGDVAGALQIDTGATGVAAASYNGGNLQHRYVDEGSKLSQLNYGRGVGTGKFKITDGFGDTATVNIDSDAESLYDIIVEINSRGLAINARVNDNGDGLIIEQDLSGTTDTPTTKLKIESVSGSVANDLNIIGEAEDIDTNAFIDGSYEWNVDLAASDSLDDALVKIRDAGVPVSATIVNSGSGATPFHLSFTSGIGGRGGELVVSADGGDLGLSSIVTGSDAKMFFGSDDPATGFLITNHSNTFDDVIDGVTIDALGASDELVTVTIKRDVDGIRNAVNGFVGSFNTVIDRLNTYDFFDTDTEQRGLLLGNPTIARVRSGMYRILQGPAEGISTSLKYLTQIGITVGDDGAIEFKQSKFDEEYDNDPEAVENLLAAFDRAAVTTEEIAPGVTVESSGDSFNARGIAELFAALADDLTDSINGTLTLADDAFNSQIEQLQGRIDAQDIRLAARRQSLVREFTAMELAISTLQSQAGSLASLAGNVSLAGG